LTLDGSAVFAARRQGAAQDGARMGLEAAREIRAASLGKLVI
jgi:hypothetical protein